jgi:hypothetical protein
MYDQNDKFYKALESAVSDGLKGSAVYTVQTALQGKEVKVDQIIAVGFATATVSFIFNLILS